MGTTATGRPRNRSWPEALKREIVAASFAPGSSVSIVARQYDVNANQVFNWRKRYSDDPRGSAVPSAPQLIPVLAAKIGGVGLQIIRDQIMTFEPPLSVRLRHFLLDLDARIDVVMYQATTWGRELYER